MGWIKNTAAAIREALAPGREDPAREETAPMAGPEGGQWQPAYWDTRENGPGWDLPGHPDQYREPEPYDPAADGGIPLPGWTDGSPGGGRENSQMPAMADPDQEWPTYESGPQEETVGPAWHPAYHDARDAGHDHDSASAIADQADRDWERGGHEGVTHEGSGPVNISGPAIGRQDPGRGEPGRAAAQRQAEAAPGGEPRVAGADMEQIAAAETEALRLWAAYDAGPTAEARGAAEAATQRHQVLIADYIHGGRAREHEAGPAAGHGEPEPEQESDPDRGPAGAGMSQDAGGRWSGVNTGEFAAEGGAFGGPGGGEPRGPEAGPGGHEAGGPAAPYVLSMGGGQVSIGQAAIGPNAYFEARGDEVTYGSDTQPARTEPQYDPGPGAGLSAEMEAGS